jgi:hypothetical protein
MALMVLAVVVAAALALPSARGRDSVPVPIAVDFSSLDARPTADIRGCPVIMCALRWEDYAADPSAYPMSNDLVLASGCGGGKSSVKLFGELEDEYLRRCAPENSSPPAPGCAPAGLVFHQARCGSTLVANLLASLPGSLVYSESKAPFDVLSGGLKDEATRVRALHVIVAAMGRPLESGAPGLYFKLESALSLHADTLRKAFPAVPWLFVHRNGVEVLASQFRRVRNPPARDAAPDARLTFSLSDIESSSIPCLRTGAAILKSGGGGAGRSHRVPVSLLDHLAAVLPGSGGTGLKQVGVEVYCAVHTGALAAAVLAAAAQARAEGLNALSGGAGGRAPSPFRAYTVLDGDSFRAAVSAARQASAAAAEDGAGQIGGVGQGEPLLFTGPKPFQRAVIDALSRHFGVAGLEPGGALESRLLEVASRYSKARKPAAEVVGSGAWGDDSEVKQDKAWPVLRNAATAHIAPFTAALQRFGGRGEHASGDKAPTIPPPGTGVRGARGAGVMPPSRQPLLPLGGGYPALFPLTDILSYWSADITTPPPDYGLYSSLARLDWRVPADREQALKLRRAELPFVLTSLPSLDATVARWSSDEALLEDMGGAASKHAMEINAAGSNHFMYWNKGQARRDTGYTPPTREAHAGAGEWLQRAHAVATAVAEEERQQLPSWWFDGAPTAPPYRPLPPLRADRELWYMRASTNQATATDNAWIHAALPFLSQSGKPNAEDGEGARPFFIVDPGQQRGIHCRFGQPGIIAEAHYDAGRNFIAMQRGRKRYVLSPPSECASLGLMKTGPSARHSELDWSDPSTWDATSPLHHALGLEVILSAGDVLYVPSNWFHYIASLDVNVQCNSRSGAPALNLAAIQSCGFKTSPTEEEGQHTSKDAMTLQPNRTRDLDAWRAVWPPASRAGPLGALPASSAALLGASLAESVAAAVFARGSKAGGGKDSVSVGVAPLVVRALAQLLPKTGAEGSYTATLSAVLADAAALASTGAHELQGSALRDGLNALLGGPLVVAPIAPAGARVRTVAARGGGLAQEGPKDGTGAGAALAAQAADLGLGLGLFAVVAVFAMLVSLVWRARKIRGKAH